MTGIDMATIVERARQGETVVLIVERTVLYPAVLDELRVCAAASPEDGDRIVLRHGSEGYESGSGGRVWLCSRRGNGQRGFVASLVVLDGLVEPIGSDFLDDLMPCLLPEGELVKGVRRG